MYPDFLYESDLPLLKPVYEACLETEIFWDRMNLEFFIDSNYDDGYYTESVKDVFSKAADFINGIIKKIKEAFTKFKIKLSEIFTNKKLENKIDELEKAMKERPELKEQKVTMPDYDQLEKLRDDIRADIQKEMKQPMNININPDKSYALEKKMKKYKKQRNIILGATAAVTITLGAALVYLKSSKDKIVGKMAKEHEEVVNSMEQKIRECESRAKDAQNALNEQIQKNKKQSETIEKQKERIKNGSRIIKALNNKLNEANAKTPGEKIKAKGKTAVDTVNEDINKARAAVNNTKKNVENVTEQVKTSATLFGDAMTDVVGRVRDTVTAISNASSLGETVDAVKKGAKNVGKAVDNASNGTTEVGTLQKLYDQLLERRPLSKKDAHDKKNQYNALKWSYDHMTYAERIKHTDDKKLLDALNSELTEYSDWLKKINNINDRLTKAKANRT